MEAQMQTGAPSRADGTVTAPAAAKRVGSGWTRAAALTGVVFAVALTSSVLGGGNEPSTTSSAAKVAHYFVVHKDQVNRHALFGAIAVLFGLGFFSYLRTYLRPRGGNALTGLYFTGVLVFALGGAIGNGIQFTLGDAPKSLSPDSMQTLNALSSDLNWPIVAVGLALMYFALASIILRTRILPAWLGWVTLLMAITSASLFFAFIPLLAAPLWVLVVSIVMAVRNPELEPTAA